MDKKISINDLKYKKRFTYFKNIPFDEKKLNQKGVKFQIIQFERDSKVAPHYHKKVTEIFTVLTGQGVIVINGTRNICEAGDIILCEPNDVHSFECIEDPWVIYVFKTNEDPKDIHWIT